MPDASDHKSNTPTYLIPAKPNWTEALQDTWLPSGSIIVGNIKPDERCTFSASQRVNEHQLLMSPGAPGGQEKPVDRAPVQNPLLEQLINLTFIQIDNDGQPDERLTRAEVDAAVTSDSINESSSRLVYLLKNEFGTVASLHDDDPGAEIDISQNDTQKLISLLRSPRVLGADLAKIIKLQDTYCNPLLKREASLFPDKQNIQKDIIPAAVRQGSIGDCYFLAALASLAATDPGSIARMFQSSSHTDGLSPAFKESKILRISFPGLGADEAILITPPNRVEQALYAQPTKHGSWPTAIEKAFGQYLLDKGVYLQRFGGGKIDDSISIPSEATDGGGNLQFSLAILTGRCPRVLSVSDSDQEAISSFLADCNERKSPVCAAINNNNIAAEAGFTVNHAYSILKYEPEAEILTIRNPLDTSDKYGSTFQLSLKDFCRYFNLVVGTQAR